MQRKPFLSLSILCKSVFPIIWWVCGAHLAPHSEKTIINISLALSRGKIWHLRNPMWPALYCYWVAKKTKSGPLFRMTPSKEGDGYLKDTFYGSRDEGLGLQVYDRGKSYWFNCILLWKSITVLLHPFSETTVDKIHKKLLLALRKCSMSCNWYTMGNRMENTCN